ncbi:response regulator transcription factor [Alteribacillus iranensis]|uniref:Regulatory protein, luxR family n=1 Tax=Alteribacillus iranensis TaxID=930128 RepID=A0A1I2EK94_9BACI|nr:LuxR C-terminal-related transcriptional regulator [Alteribacillus iranensis]SFE92821.1 regulatory protein, luxR family [Alteribacillus iranensis]
MIQANLTKSTVAKRPILFLDTKDNTSFLSKLSNQHGKEVEEITSQQVCSCVEFGLKKDCVYYSVCDEDTLIQKAYELRRVPSSFRLAVNVSVNDIQVVDSLFREEAVSIILASDRERKQWGKHFERAQSFHVYVDPLFQPYLIEKYREMKSEVEHESEEKDLRLDTEKALTVLSQAEARILEKILEGKSNRRIAEEYFLSVATVNNHVSHIAKKMNAKDRTHTVKRAIEEDWVIFK